MSPCDKICVMENRNKKNSLIASLLLFASLFAIFFACISICFTPLSISVAEETVSPVADEDKTEKKDIFEILDYFDISQEGYVFKKNDFITNYGSNGNSLALYTNRTVTINTVEPANGNLTYTFSVAINSLTTIKQLEDNGYIYRDPLNNEIISYVLDINGKTDDIENYIYLNLEIHYPPSEDRPGGYNETLELPFYIVQTPTNFEKENSSATNEFILWKYVYNNQPITTTAPGNGETFTTLNLTFPSGTKLNPVYVKFIYCGEHYEIYRYSYEEAGEKITKTFNSANDEEIDITELSFNKSGTYTVRIFDKTVNSSCPNKNFYEYKFIIKNTSLSTDGFFINAQDESGNPIMNGQYTNSNVTTIFENWTSDFKSQVNKITVIRAYQPSISENIPVEKTYLPEELPSSLTFSEDGTYDIKFENRRGDILSEYKFVITKSIKTSFKIGDTIYRIADDEASNETKEFSIDNTATSTYNGILGKTNFSFNILVARSEPSIVGVSNNERTSNAVNLKVYGVGKIDVYISLNGTQMMLETEYENGGRLPTLTEQGSYFIKVTDEMGSVTTKTFTVTMKLNTASIILIVIASIALVGLVVFIIFSRGKVKVR